MAPGKATSDVTDGPTLSLINKRIRNLRKKLNRIAHLEDCIAQGKLIIKNKDQEKLLKSKPTIIALINELENFRQPLSVAVHLEITLALKGHRNDNNEDCNKAKKAPDTEQHATVDDLLSLIYFGNMFDAKPESDFNPRMLSLLHERNRRLMDDFMTSDSDSFDLDMMALMGSLLTSRSVGSGLSHQNALQRCIELTNLWLSKSEQQIVPNSDITYAGLREKLTKIMGLDSPADDGATAVACKSECLKGSVTTHQQKEENIAADHQSSETSVGQSSATEEMLDQTKWFYNYDDGEQEPWRPYQCPIRLYRGQLIRRSYDSDYDYDSD